MIASNDESEGRSHTEERETSKREFRIEMRSNPYPDPRDPWPTNWEGRESCRYACRDEALSDAAKIPLPACRELRVIETGGAANAPRGDEGLADTVRRAMAVRVIYKRRGGQRTCWEGAPGGMMIPTTALMRECGREY